jgi:ribonuclease J
MGLPLPENEQNELEIEGITKGEMNCDGIFLTHYHSDHIGEISNLMPQIPIYSSVCTKGFIKAYQRHMGRNYACNIDVNRIISVMDGETVSIGELKVRAIKADHSSAGAFMYLIEAGDKHILHTGDFRLHGRNRDKLIKDISGVGKIDLLITEGTTLSRYSDKKLDEESVCERIGDCVKKYKYCFAITSSSNMDRIQSISKSVPTGKYFIVDKFQKELIDISNSNENYDIRKALDYGHNLDKGMNRHGFVMIIRESNSKLYKEYMARFPDKTCLIYSMWSGYLKYPGIKKLVDVAGDNWQIIHSSGHVVLDDLNEFVDIIKPNKIVVIHTDVDNVKFDGNILSIEDGEPFFV